MSNLGTIKTTTDCKHSCNFNEVIFKQKVEKKKKEKTENFFYCLMLGFNKQTNIQI